MSNGYNPIIQNKLRRVENLEKIQDFRPFIFLLKSPFEGNYRNAFKGNNLFGNALFGHLQTYDMMSPAAFLPKKFRF